MNTLSDNSKDDYCLITVREQGDAFYYIHYMQNDILDIDELQTRAEKAKTLYDIVDNAKKLSCEHFAEIEQREDPELLYSAEIDMDSKKMIIYCDNEYTERNFHSKLKRSDLAEWQNTVQNTLFNRSYIVQSEASL